MAATENSDIEHTPEHHITAVKPCMFDPILNYLKDFSFENKIYCNCDKKYIFFFELDNFTTLLYCQFDKPNKFHFP